MSTDRVLQPSGSPRWAALLLLGFSVLFASLSASAQGVPKKEFPRLGGYQIGRSPYPGFHDPEYQRAIARLDYAILGMATIKEANDHAAAIRRLNPNIILAKYTILQMVDQTARGYMEIKRNKMAGEQGPNSTNARDWYARDGAGDLTENWPGTWNANITNYVKRDSSGDTYSEWSARLDYDWFIHDDVWDAVYNDSVFWAPRRPKGGNYPDWSGGRESDGRKINSEFRRGHQAYWNKMKELAPGKYIFVNHDWYRFEDPSVTGDLASPEYNKQVHGGLLEIMMQSSDLEGQPRVSWDKVMFGYRRSATYFKDPNMTLFMVKGEPDNYRFLRYSFATCLLGDAYFDYAPPEYTYGTVEWFDEFDLAGTATTSWLGLALDSPPTSEWKSGVWRRDFQNGTAIVNPRGNGVTTVTIEKGFRRIAGRQDPVVNNGQEASTITLQDGDGIILVRDKMVSLPALPEPPVLRHE